MEREILTPVKQNWRSTLVSSWRRDRKVKILKWIFPTEGSESRLGEQRMQDDRDLVRNEPLRLENDPLCSKSIQEKIRPTKGGQTRQVRLSQKKHKIGSP